MVSVSLEPMLLFHTIPRLIFSIITLYSRSRSFEVCVFFALIALTFLHPTVSHIPLYTLYYFE